MMIRNFKRLLIHSIYPTVCAGCGCIIPYDRLLCDVCTANMPTVTGELCSVCFNEKSRCDCRDNPKWFKQSCAPFAYDGAAKNAIIRLKDYKDKAVAEFFADKMAEEVSERFRGVKFDAVIPVPLNRDSLRRRGYNQSELLASALARRIGAPLRTDLLIKSGKNKRQHTLDYKSRRENVKGVYEALPFDEPINTALLTDDIITTGFTLSECAKTLSLAGVREIYAVGAAKNIRINNK